MRQVRGLRYEASIEHEDQGSALRVPQNKVAFDRTSPHGLVVGIDVIPAQPPTGVSTIQGNFLSSAVQDGVKRFLRGAQQEKSRRQPSSFKDSNDGLLVETEPAYLGQGEKSGVLARESLEELRESTFIEDSIDYGQEDSVVDVVLSDMSAPWEQTDGFWKRSLSNPYYRMMNTSGIKFRDHTGSMVCPMIQCI
ncbi:MAG: hypothetical protein Q9216_001144 [Gyalolechia sp. 2 TL-2023]